MSNNYHRELMNCKSQDECRDSFEKMINLKSQLGKITQKAKNELLNYIRKVNRTKTDTVKA